MAGDWIKFEATTPEKPEVHNMAAELSLDPDAVVGKLMRVWLWADQQSVSGEGIQVSRAFLDRITFCPGFAAAMQKVGWLEGTDGALCFPHFDRHNGQTAKDRSMTGRRMQKKRIAAPEVDETPAPCDAPSVTSPSPEKRREEDLSERGREKEHDRRPDLRQAKLCASQIGITAEAAEVWWLKREASGWVRATAGGGTTAISSNWQADLQSSRTWAEEEANRAAAAIAARTRSPSATHASSSSGNGNSLRDPAGGVGSRAPAVASYAVTYAKAVPHSASPRTLPKKPWE